MSKHDGGPAFPLHGSLNHTGMTLRDWLAGQVVQECLKQYGALSSGDARKSVELAYSIADAMLAERDAPRRDER